MRPADSKDALRSAIQTRRGTLSARQWALDDSARTRVLLSALGDSPATVALYASRPREPGTRDAINRLHEAGWRTLLPVLGASPQWALFSGWERMQLGWGNIPEPIEPDMAHIDLSQADVVVIAALAVAADGARLGTGGGWYDRALPQRRSGTPVWALARSQELLEVLPVERHDVPVNRVVTELGIHTCGEEALISISTPWQSELS